MTWLIEYDQRNSSIAIKRYLEPLIVANLHWLIRCMNSCNWPCLQATVTRMIKDDTSLKRKRTSTKFRVLFSRTILKMKMLIWFKTVKRKMVQAIILLNSMTRMPKMNNHTRWIKKGPNLNNFVYSLIAQVIATWVAVKLKINYKF